MSEIDEKQLVLYAQMANLVNRILQWPEINIREVAENFSKVHSEKLHACCLCCIGIDLCYECKYKFLSYSSCPSPKCLECTPVLHGVLLSRELSVSYIFVP